MAAEIIAFPLSRRQKLVSDLALVLSKKHGAEANRFWRDTSKTLLQHLTAAGASLEHAEDQVRDLLYAIIAEIEAETAMGQG